MGFQLGSASLPWLTDAYSAAMTESTVASVAGAAAARGAGSERPGLDGLREKRRGEERTRQNRGRRGCGTWLSCPSGRAAARDPVVEWKNGRLRGEHQDEEKQGESRDHVGVELVERLLEQVPERHDEEHEAEGDQRFADAEADEDERTPDELDDGIVTPVSQRDQRRKKRVRVGVQEPFVGVPAGVSVKIFQTPAMKKIRPRTPRAKKIAQARRESRKVPGDLLSAGVG